MNMNFEVKKVENEDEFLFSHYDGMIDFRDIKYRFKDYDYKITAFIPEEYLESLPSTFKTKDGYDWFNEKGLLFTVIIDRNNLFKGEEYYISDIFGDDVSDEIMNFIQDIENNLDEYLKDNLVDFIVDFKCVSKIDEDVEIRGFVYPFFYEGSDFIRYYDKDFNETHRIPDNVYDYDEDASKHQAYDDLVKAFVNDRFLFSDFVYDYRYDEKIIDRNDYILKINILN